MFKLHFVCANAPIYLSNENDLEHLDFFCVLFKVLFHINNISFHYLLNRSRSENRSPSDKLLYHNLFQSHFEKIDSILSQFLTSHLQTMTQSSKCSLYPCIVFVNFKLFIIWIFKNVSTYCYWFVFCCGSSTVMFILSKSATIHIGRSKFMNLSMNFIFLSRLRYDKLQFFCSRHLFI